MPNPNHLSLNSQGLCFRYQGHVGSSLIIGGTDVMGAHLYSVYPHGSYDKLPYLTMGTCSCLKIS